MLLRGLAFALLSLVLTAPTWAQGTRPTLNALEKQQLPQHCWGSSHGDPQKYGRLPQYNIPRVCGKQMNHLCNGHMYLIASQRLSLQPRDRRFYAQKAIGEFNYTQRHMTPECPLKAEVANGITMARFIEKR